MQKVGKTNHNETKKTDWLLIISIFFFLYPISLKVNSPAFLCLRDNQHLFLIMHWSYFKYNDILHTKNVYKISNQISVSEILFWKYLEYVSLILRNYKKLKSTKIFRFTVSSILSAQ